MANNVEISEEKRLNINDLFDMMHETIDNTKTPKLCFFLGAGCSVSSNIPTGGGIIEIVQKILFYKKNYSSQHKIVSGEYIFNGSLNEKIENFYNSNKDDFDKYVKEVETGFKTRFLKKGDDELVELLPESFKKDLSGIPNIIDFLFEDSLYGSWLNFYNGDNRERQKLFEKIIEKKEPHGSYILFSHLINERLVKNVFTTNFDDLLNYSLSRYYDIYPRIFSHNETAAYINIHSDRPNIIKLHGDYLFQDIKNIENETQSLEKNMEEKFGEALNQCGLVVIGYKGADHSIMKILEERKKNLAGKYFLLWITDDKNKLHWRVKKLLEETPNSYFLEIESFEIFIAKLWNLFGFLPIEIKQKAEERQHTYLAHVERAVLEDDKRGIELFDLANRNHKLGKSEEALKNVQDLLKLLPYNSVVYGLRGNIYADLKMRNEAMNDYNTSIFLRYDNIISHFNRGLLYEELEMFDLALKDLDRTIELGGSSIDYFNNRGILHIELKNYDKAILDFNKALEINPNDAMVYNNRGNLFRILKSYELSFADFEKVLELNPEHTDVYFNRGLLYFTFEKYTEALIDFNRYIQANPDKLEAYKNRGLLYYETKDYKNAIIDFDKVISLEPDKPNFYNLRGIAHCMLNNNREAIEDFNKSIKLDSNNYETYFARGYSQFCLKNYNEAISDYLISIRINPDYITSYLHIIELYIANFNYELSYEKIITAAPIPKTNKEELTWNYLSVITKVILGKSYSENSERFEELYKKNTLVEWDTKEIETWLIQVDLPLEKKKLITEITSKMKKLKIEVKSGFPLSRE